MHAQPLTGQSPPSVQNPHDDRATQFKAVEGSPAAHSGTLLVVEAYTGIWLILFFFVWITLRRQHQLDARILELEKALSVTRKDPSSL